MSYLFPFADDKHIRFLDHSCNKKIFNITNEAMISFALDDAIAETVGNHVAPPTVRTWVHDPTIVLGIPDSRLPYIQDGIQFIESIHAKAVIRNSGGLAVFLNPGVLNMSVIIPNNPRISINDGYEMMYQFIQQLFYPYTDKIEAYEIAGSYCPGDFDLSICGVKFAGISQRRVRNGIAAQIYIDVTGNSQKRAQTVKTFYDISKRGDATSYHYPEINPHTMGTISELLAIPFTVGGVIANIKRILSTDYHMVAEKLLLEEEKPFFKRLKQMKKRNERLWSL